MTTPDGVAETVINSEAMAWIPLGDGEWFKPLGFGPGGWRRLLLRLSPGTVVARHRHRGEVHAFNVAGHRQIVGRDEIIGPGGYVYEPAGNIDTWSCVGTEDCVVSIIVAGAMEYLDDEDRVIAVRRHGVIASDLPPLVRGDRDRARSAARHHTAPGALKASIRSAVVRSFR